MAAVAPLVEREHELGLLVRYVVDAVDGTGRVVLIHGPAGIGKSRLLAEARQAAETRGMLVVQARASQLERDFAFGVVRQLFEAVAFDPVLADVAFEGAAAPARAVLGALAGDETAGDDTSFAALHGLFWVSLNLSNRQPLLISVDDLHWCDQGSLRFLTYLVRRLDGLPILLVATLRSGEPGVDPSLIGELTHDPAEVSVQPGPLSLPAIVAVLREQLGQEPDDSFAGACLRATGGNPLLLRQLVRALEAEGVRPDASHADRVREIGPRAVSRTLLLRLARLDDAAVAVARAVAVLGDSADLRAVRRLTGLDEVAVAEATTALAAVEILQPEAPLGFVHPLVRDAVYQDVPLAEREIAHARAADVLDELAAPEDAVAAQLLYAARRGEPGVVERLREAARGARRRGAAESAVAYLARALEEPPPDDVRPQLLLELGLAEMLTNGPAGGEHLATAYRTLSDPHDRVLAAGTLARATILIGSPADSRALALEAAAGLPPEMADERRQLESIAALAPFFGIVSRDDQDALREWREVSEERLQGPGARLLAGLAAYDWMQQGGSAAACTDLALRSLEGGEMLAYDNGLVSIGPLWTLAIADCDEPLTGLWNDVFADAHQRGSLFSISAAHLWFGGTLSMRGALPEAEEMLRTALAQFNAWGNNVGMRYASAFLTRTLIARGDLSGARAALEIERDPGGLADGALYWVLARTELLLAENAVQEALDSATAADVRFDWLRNPAMAAWGSLRAEGLARLGRTEEAIPILERELEAARSFGAPSPIARTLRLLGTYRGEDGLAALEEAVALAAASPAKLEQARCHAALGEVLRRARRPSDAREPLRRALELAEACGARSLSDRVRAELYATGARPRTSALSGVEALTASERRVAALAAEGHTNRDIAQTLFVTPKTVEVHLSNAYRKLGVRSRRELEGALA